jgi:hypothetical protein
MLEHPDITDLTETAFDVAFLKSTPAPRLARRFEALLNSVSSEAFFGLMGDVLELE